VALAECLLLFILPGLNSVHPAREYNALSQALFKLDKVNLIYYVKKLEK